MDRPVAAGIDCREPSCQPARSVDRVFPRRVAPARLANLQLAPLRPMHPSERLADPAAQGQPCNFARPIDTPAAPSDRAFDQLRGFVD